MADKIRETLKRTQSDVYVHKHLETGVSRMEAYQAWLMLITIIQECDMSALVEDVAELLLVSIDKNVEFKHQLAKNFPAIEADVSQMHQIICVQKPDLPATLQDMVEIILS